jgi:hypothetical protein
MRYTKMLAWAVMVAGVMVTGAQAKAEEWGEHRDLRNDYARTNALRNHLASDRYRADEAARCGRPWEAAELRHDIARDEAALHAQYRDIRHDRR